MKTFIQESRFFNSTESDLVHPSRSSGLVVSGDPVVVGRLVGVASTSAAATTDLISIDTEGVHDLTVAIDSQRNWRRARPSTSIPLLQFSRTIRTMFRSASAITATMLAHVVGHGQRPPVRCDTWRNWREQLIDPD
jgi:hypothetical protein